jgi:membrane dipeptidase
MSEESIEQRVNRLHASGLVDMHFDLPMDLYEKRNRANIVETEFLPEFEAGNLGVIGVAIYIEDHYLPDQALSIAQGQLEKLRDEVGSCPRLAICTSYDGIQKARASDQIALVITMEGVEPLGNDLNLLPAFYDLGVRSIGLTHARKNAAANGAIFAATGSPPDGLTPFGRDLVRECEARGLIIDLAHINAAGFKDVVDLTRKPLIVSHTNARKFNDIERNISDDQIKMIGERGGVIGINSVLVGPTQNESTLDRYIDHIEHVASLIGIDGVGIGFDFFEFIYEQWPEETRRKLEEGLTRPYFISDLTNHSQARNLTRRMIERGFSDEHMEKILFRNWMGIFEQLLNPALSS